MDNKNKLLENFLRFIRLLRKSGIKVGSQSSIDALNSIKTLNIGNRNEFYWALHSNLINKKEDTEIFDQCFYLFWQNPKILQQMFNLLLPQIGTQKAPANNKKQLKRISDNFQKKNKNIENDKKDEIVFDAQMSWSNKSALNSKDFEMMSLDEIHQAEKEIKKILIRTKTQISRRWERKEKSSKIYTKYTIKKSVRNNGIIQLAFKEKIKKFKPLVILIDISGSMESYSRIMLFLSHILIQEFKNVEIFTFGTKLTRITQFLKNKDVDFSLDKVGKSVNDWASGTKITSSIKDFNLNWSRRILTQNQKLLLITDGLEREDKKNLDFEFERLSLFSQNIIWLNPLLRYKKFEPKVESIKTILKYVDKHVPIHNVNSVQKLIANIV